MYSPEDSVSPVRPSPRPPCLEGCAVEVIGSASLAKLESSHSTAEMGPLLANASVQAGFPSPAEDHACERVDLNKVLIKHPLATFLMRVRGASMREAGIDDGDVLLVDRSITPSHGHIVVAVVDGEFTVKRLWKRGSNVKLQAANPTFPDIRPKDGQTMEVWGVVTTSIRSMRV